MSSIHYPVSDMLVTVKSREVQRALIAESSGGQNDARRHYLAAAHLELVLAADNEEAGDDELSRRSRISAASCLWRAGQMNDAQAVFDDLNRSEPARASEIQDVIEELKAK